MKNDPWILGISASHNGAVCLLKGDEIVVAIQEERLSRTKRDRIYGARPSRALEYCFDYAGIGPSDLAMVVLSAQDRLRNPAQDLKLNSLLQIQRYNIPIAYISHHFAHAVSVFATSGFEDAAILVIDGVGSPSEDLSEDERRVVAGGVAGGWEIISLYSGDKTSVKTLDKRMSKNGVFTTYRKDRMPRFESLGGMFAAVSVQLFGNDMEAGKVMGLAPFGRQTIPVDKFFNIVDGGIEFCDDVPKMYGHNDRWPLRKVEYENLSYSVQAALEDALFFLIDKLQGLCPSKNLCYAGGVALNSVANELIIRDSGYQEVYIAPAAEDSGPAIGAAYYGLWQLTQHNSRRILKHDAMGRIYSAAEISEAIDRAPGIQRIESQDVVADAARLLTDGKIVGWFQGRSELGPRALGQRSIFCDPRRPEGKDILNSRVKHREAFRPFAPAILLEETGNWFELDGTTAASPFMLRVCDFKEGKADKVPAVAHVDGTGRVQTVCGEDNGRFYELVKAFNELTGVPIVLNTSFNVMGEPIVETPEDALWCLLRTGIDYCVLEDEIVTKKETYQAEALRKFVEHVRELKQAVHQRDAAGQPGLGRRETDGLLEKIHEATMVAIPRIEQETVRLLGSLPADLKPRNIEKFWKVSLSDEVWQNVGEEARAHLMNGKFLHSNLVKHSDHNVDWIAINTEYSRALAVELDQKLMAMFGSWLSEKRRTELVSLSSSSNGQVDKNEWLRFVEGSCDSGGRNDKHRLSLDSISWAFSSLARGNSKNTNPFQARLLELLREFVGGFEAGAVDGLFAELPQRLNLALAARNSSLQSHVLGQDRVDGFLVGIQWLFPRLVKVSEVSAQLDSPD